MLNNPYMTHSEAQWAICGGQGGVNFFHIERMQNDPESKFILKLIKFDSKFLILVFLGQF